MLNWRKWLRGLSAAYIGGGAAAVSGAISIVMIAPTEFNMTDKFFHLLLYTTIQFIIAGIISASYYLKSSPVPEIEIMTTTKTTEVTQSSSISKVALAFILSLGLFGCATQVATDTPPPTPESIVLKYADYAKLSAKVACSLTLQLAVSDKDRVDKANIVYSIAHAIRSLSGGDVTPEALAGVIVLWAPDKAHWADLAGAVKDNYATLYATYLHGNPYLIAKFLEALALGCEQAASNYRVVSQ